MNNQPTIDKLLITGASGFLGQSILNHIATDTFKQIYALSRSPLPKELTERKRIQRISASLAEVEKYQTYLGPDTAVIHCAAATGKCSRDDYFEVNTTGTQHIVQASHQKGVKKFLHTSTVAVSFDDIKHYHYATSKLEAERHVEQSEIQYIILRPTIILGNNAPQCALLKKLIVNPFALLPSGGRNLLQPIHVDDLANAMIELVLDAPFSKEVIEIGGNDTLSLKEFIGKLNGNKRTLNLPIPISLLEQVLRIMEHLKFNFLPITAGQLCFFKNNIVARKNSRQFNIKYPLSDLIKCCNNVD